MRIAGLDLGKRHDFSALVTLDAGKAGAVVTGALRLPHASYREQLGLIAPLLTEADHVLFDATGVGDAVAELLPRDAIPVVLVAGAGAPVWRTGRLHVGKGFAVEQILLLAGAGRLRVAPDCPGGADLKRELKAFAATSTRRGVRLQARAGHDDLVLALGLAGLGCRMTLGRSRDEGAPPTRGKAL